MKIGESSKKQKLIQILLYALLLIFISIPLLGGYLYRISGGHDINFHLMRIEGLTEGLRMGQFPVKIQPAWYEGYGYGCSVFYGDIFLYVPALLRLFGVPLQWAYKFYVLMTQAGTIAISEYSFGRIFKDKKIAFIGTALYALAIYRIMNIFVRGAVGEYTAMAFLPLVAYAMILLISKESTKQDLKKGSLLLALGMTGILQSHILSAEMVCIILAIICIVYVKRVFKTNIFGSFVKAVCLTLLLNLGFLVPFLDYMITGKFNVNAINGGWRVEQNIQEYGAFVSQLCQLFYKAGGGNLLRSEGTEGEMPIGVGLALISALVVLGIMVIQLKKDEKQQFTWKLAKISAFIACLSLFMSTCYFPWEMLRKSNVLIRYIVINLQFPWRFCTIASVSLVLLWCCLLQIALTKWNRKVVTGISVGVMGISLLTAGLFMADVLKVGNAFVAVFSRDMDTNVESGEEYLPVNTISDEFDTDNIYKNENVIIRNLSRKGIQLRFTCVNNSDTEQTVDLPLLYYKGYAAVARNEAGIKQHLACMSGNNQVVSIIVPEGFHGNVTVMFKEPIYWRVAEFITLISVIGIIISELKILHKREKYVNMINN